MSTASTSTQGTSVLYLSYDGLTDPLGQSQVLPYLRGLQQRGYTITVVAFEKPERFTAEGERMKQETEAAGLHWVPLMYTKRPPVLSTLYDIRKLRRTCLQLLREQDYQIVHCRSYITALVGRHLQEQHQLRFLFDMRGFYADERVDGGIWRLSNPLFKLVYNYFKRKEQEFFSKADHSISLTHAAKAEVNSWPGLSNCPISVIPCCVDTALFDPATVSDDQITQLREELQLQQEPVMIYVGSVGTWYMVEEMMRTYRQLLEAQPELIFLFLTRDAPEQILEIARRQGIPTDRIRVQPSPRTLVPAYLSLADLSIFYIKPVFSKKASSATKMAEIMAMGLPFICNKGWGDTEKIVAELNATTPQAAAVLTTPNGELDLATAPGKLEPYDARQEHFFEEFTLDYGVSIYAEVYEKLLKKQG